MVGDLDINESGDYTAYSILSHGCDKEKGTYPRKISREVKLKSDEPP
jgi:hypothetical protein